jgi:probable rRNA maturation factor
MERLHLEFLGEAGTTDVLSFDLRDRRHRAAPGFPFEAEIAIGVEVAEREARKRRHTVQREVELYLIHGLLHLAGFDDHKPRDRAKMRRAERRILSDAGWLETGSPG